jgi:hypothetical protein
MYMFVTVLSQGKQEKFPLPAGCAYCMGPKTDE